MKQKKYHLTFLWERLMTQLLLLIAAIPAGAQLIQINLEVTGDFFLGYSSDSPPIFPNEAPPENYAATGDYLRQTTLSQMADRNQESIRKLRELKWLEIKSLENVQFILDIQHEPWWVRAPTLRFLQDGAGSLVESKTICEYPASLCVGKDIESRRHSLTNGKPRPGFTAWLGYPVDCQAKIIICYTN